MLGGISPSSRRFRRTFFAYEAQSVTEPAKMKDADENFYERADSHIHLSNDQLKVEHGRGKVSASMMYATARFNAWVSACGFSSADQMAGEREKTIAYFVEQYRLMLEENVDDYISNFNTYMKAGSK